MTSRAALVGILAALGASLVAVQQRHLDAPAGAEPLLYLVADSERELTRLPARFTRLSDEEEIRAGNGIAGRDAPRTGYDADDRAIDAVVQRVGARTAAGASRKLPYRFHYLADRGFVNAFAVPGGHIFIGGGLIELMTTEDELASVLAHEIEHVDHYHCAERLQVEKAIRHIPGGTLLTLPAFVFQAGYSKDQELEADREGVQLAARAGYSAEGAVRLFETVDRLSKPPARARSLPQEAVRTAGGLLSGYFRSHPLTPGRIAEVKAMIAREPVLAAHPEQPLAISYISDARRSRDDLIAGKFAKAADAADRVLAAHPDYAPALEVVVDARFASGNAAAGQDALRKLLPIDNRRAGAAVAWIKQRAQGLLNDRRYVQATALTRPLLQIVPNEIELLRLDLLGSVAAGDAAGAHSDAAGYLRFYPQQAPAFEQEIASYARTLQDSGSFAHASLAAEIALTLRPDDPPTRLLLGDSLFAQASFSAAAASYEGALHFFAPEAEVARTVGSLADALASANPRTAAANLEAALGRHGYSNQPSRLRTVFVEIAGVRLLAGDDGLALQLKAGVAGRAMPPELLTRLGWWYLRARRLDEADAVLQLALSQRPGAAAIQHVLGYVDLEAGKDAVGRFNELAIDSDPPVYDTPAMGRAIALWLQGAREDAIKQYETAVAAHPQWTNPAWRDAIYPPRISGAVQAMDAERRRPRRGA